MARATNGVGAAMMAGGLLCGLVQPASAADGIPYCEAGNTVMFAGIDWQSGAFITEVMKAILSQGYGCTVDSIPGNSVTLEQATANNDVQIFAEEWVGRSDVWNNAAAAGQVLSVGAPFSGATEGWFVPAFLVRGDEAPAAGLKSVEDLKKPEIVKLFSDPEEPSKGRFLNCPSGWTCEGVSTNKLEAYGLTGQYVNFRPGTGAALDAAITSAMLQRQPILFYYWSPNAIMSKFDLVQLEEPPHTEECWATLTTADADDRIGCAFPTVEVAYGVNAEFAGEAPEIIGILEKATFPLSEINAALAYMTDNDVDAKAAAKHFIETKADIWGPWTSEEARAALGGE